MDRIDQPPEEPTPSEPRESRILSEPATVAACQHDYADAADVRQTMAQQDAGRRH